MLYIVGLGLGDERDITVRGLDAVRRCAKVYMEAYTSLLSLGLDPASLANLVRLSAPSSLLLDARYLFAQMSARPCQGWGRRSPPLYARFVAGEDVREGDHGGRPGDGGGARGPDAE